LPEDIELSPEVARALADGRPLVALESSLIAHGLPVDEAAPTGRAAEAAVRKSGAVPATVAVLGGRIRVGLDDAAMARLAGGQAAKAGARDLGVLVATGADAGTTVSATARIAAAVGIRVFATGGVGGVHRRFGGAAGEAADVSADLPELARSRVAVVAAGAKMILDLPQTLELLETLGVPVIGFGTGRFPAFYTADSGLGLAHRVDDVATLARALRVHWGFNDAGALVCQPPPADVALPADEAEALVDAALSEAHEAGIAGPAVTPFVLSAMRRLSGGRTLETNKALVLANAALGGRLAVALAQDGD